MSDEPDMPGDPPRMELDPYKAAPPVDVQAVWRSADGCRVEHLHLLRDGRMWAADGVIVGVHGGTATSDATSAIPLRAHYAILLDARWHVRQVSVDIAGRAPLRLRADGNGRWETGLAEPLPDFDGILDVDLSLTPFTNTIPIRRLGLAAGQEHAIRTLYIDVPSLALSVATQRYVCDTPFGRQNGQDKGADHGRYAYGSVTTGAAVDLSVDGQGLVIDYPLTFHRLNPPPTSGVGTVSAGDPA